MQVMHAQRQGGIGAEDVLLATVLVGRGAAHVVPPRRQIERDAVAENQAECNQALRRQAVVVTTLRIVPAEP